MEFKGTPGTWKIVGHWWSDTSIISGSKTICTNSLYGEATEETQEELENEVSANFTLIAAHPDLLQALVELLAFCKSHNMDNHFTEQADLAILKALTL